MVHVPFIIVTSTNNGSGGAICGAFVLFGGLSILLYKPWRRRVDKKRLGNAHFEPLTQGTDTAVLGGEEQQRDEIDRNTGRKEADTEIQSFETAALAEPSHR